MKQKQKTLCPGYWDIHCHLLPGIDDGASCIGETEDLLKAEYVQDIRNIIFTPHFGSSMFEVSAQEREKVFNDTLSKLSADFLQCKFYLGCEYYVGETFPEDLKDMRCRMAGTNVVLLEFSHNVLFRSMDAAVSTARENGYIPILAHAERCLCLYESEEYIKKLKKQGVRIQLNAGSVIGNNGRSAKKFCARVIEEGLADFVASDAHNMDSRPVLMGKAIESIRKKYSQEKVLELFKLNQEALFE